MIKPKEKLKLINTSKSADDFLMSSLPPKQFKQVFTKLWGLRINSRPNDSVKLSGFDHKYRTDVGEYRIIYSFNDSIVNIETIGKRNDGDVYKKFKNK